MRKSFRRQAVPSQVQAQAIPHTFVAPVRGWIKNENLANAKKGGASIIENWFPTATGIRLRGGSEKHATTGTAAVESLFAYTAGSTRRLFAADLTKIFNITAPASPSTAPTPDVILQTSGEYSTVQYSTSAGAFLYAVNGTDGAMLYDGTRWDRITQYATYGLAFDAQTANFTQGTTVTGGTSGATATIISQTDSGATGTLYVQNIVGGPFQDNETITDGSGGSATANIPTGVSTVQTATITGVTTSTLTQVWSYRNRLYFVQKNTMDAWYLPSDQIGGAATKISMRGIFQKGGYLLFGATWSMDAGDGPDDICVFVSTLGEVAVYEGSSPAESDWRIVGRYDITTPLGKNAHMQAGGDLVVLTVDGMVPLSAALKKDPAALSLDAVSFKIEPEWKARVAARQTIPWQILKWTAKNMAILSQPVIDLSTPAECLVVNLETGAWCKYTGWDVRSLAVLSDQAYFGSSDGKVYKAEKGGTDNSSPYTCTYVGQFEDIGRRGEVTDIKLARATFRTGWQFNPKVSVSVDYAVTLPSPPDATVILGGTNVWDIAVWDTAIWSGVSELSASTKWVAIGRTGSAAAPQVQITVSQTNEPATELVSLDLLYERGAIVV